MVLLRGAGMGLVLMKAGGHGARPDGDRPKMSQVRIQSVAHEDDPDYLLVVRAADAAVSRTGVPLTKVPHKGSESYVEDDRAILKVLLGSDETIYILIRRDKVESTPAKDLPWDRDVLYTVATPGRGKETQFLLVAALAEDEPDEDLEENLTDELEKLLQVVYPNRRRGRGIREALRARRNTP
jgi:hypothetical protein